MEFETFIKKNNLGSINKDLSFKSLTTIGCGGKIKYVYFPKNISSLIKAYKFILDNNLKYFIIGNGSNTLASDNYFDGIIICLRRMKYSYFINGDILTTSAFYPTAKLAYDLSILGLGDLSFLGGIPGLLGGAVYNNSGAFDDNIGNHILSVRYINTNGELIEIEKNNCCFGYRESIFQKLEGIIIDVKLKLEIIQTKEKLEKMKRKRQLSQPIEAKSMGSIFKNNPLIPAWKVIDGLGLRGFKHNDAEISMKHANFIINTKNAFSSDILALIELIENRSKLELGIELFKEISII